MNDEEAMKEINAIIDRYINTDMEQRVAMGQIAYISGRNAHHKRKSSEDAGMPE